MKKIALVFLLAVFVPSLVLAWLAVRSLRDQQLVLERQQTLLCQGVADALAKDADTLANRQHEFGQQVETLLFSNQTQDVTTSFNGRLRAIWPMADVGFVVTTGGRLLCPTALDGQTCKTFYHENGKFVCNIQSEEVFSGNNNFQMKSQSQQYRNVVPQQQLGAVSQQNSKLNYSDAGFRQLVGDSKEGTVARFLENKLSILLWYRPHGERDLIFGAQLSLPALKLTLLPVVRQFEPALRNDIAVALLDENAKPVAISLPNFKTDWKHPFVASELGETLPHWEMAVYLLHPGKLAESARLLRSTLGLLIGILVLAIGIGGWLIVTDLNRQLYLARQKTDFVSNVSHELKTPLTSIRMFAELLAEGRVSDAVKSRSYLNIIAGEASRLTRLINNVLDFSRLERGEKKYDFQPCDLAAVVRDTVQTYRPHLEANGFTLRAEFAAQSIPIRGDRDALAQVLVNLLSNAEKYSNTGREISVELKSSASDASQVEVRVLDRGPGVTAESAEKIFEQFYRAHDSLSSGIQGSGLGLTLARQIARAHGGDVLYQPRAGGGSCFILRLPLSP